MSGWWMLQGRPSLHRDGDLIDLLPVWWIVPGDDPPHSQEELVHECVLYGRAMFPRGIVLPDQTYYITSARLMSFAEFVEYNRACGNLIG